MNILQASEFEQIYSQVSQKIISDSGKHLFANEGPAGSYATAVKRMEETKEAVTLLDAGLMIPFMGMQHAQHETDKIEKGFVLMPQELVAYGDFLRSMPRIKSFLTSTKTWRHDCQDMHLRWLIFRTSQKKSIKRFVISKLMRMQTDHYERLCGKWECLNQK